VTVLAILAGALFVPLVLQSGDQQLVLY